MKNRFFIACLWFCSVVALAQQKPLVTSIDKTKQKIGGEFKLTLKASVDTTAKVAFPSPKNIGPLEVIESYKIDTVRNGSRYDLIKKYGLTQFDSGRYVIPKVTVLINNQPFFSDSLRVEVVNVPVDTLKQKMYDIKPITEVASSKSWIWKLLLALLLLVGIGAFVYWYMKVRQRKKIEEEIYKTPIEKATSLLNTLEKKQLWQKGEVKAYYSELTDIARTYIEEAIEIPAMESTTSELIEALRTASLKKKMKLTPETIENLERVLKQADLVKFAKSKPLDFEITEDRQKIERSIVILDKAIPVVVEENQEELLLNELQRQEQLKLQLKKKRKSRITMAVAVVIGIATAVLTFMITTKGFTYVKDELFGNASKELLEGEWVYSEYGNPAVVIETPQVLKRTDLSKMLPKENMALIKEMQSFRYGGLLDDFQIMVSTLKYKQEGEIDLSKAIESTVQLMQALGAENMLVKQEEFDTKQGVRGMRAFGTYSKLNKLTNSSTKYYYEIILFNQEGGLQQITLQHEEGDEYGKKIFKRILNSVELKKLGS